MSSPRRLGLRIGALVYIAVLIVVPVGSVFYRAFEKGFVAAYDAISTTDGVHALILTVIVVAIAVPMNTVFGVFVSLLLARRRFVGSRVLDALIDIPLAVSPVIVGVSLVLVYGQGGWFGSWLVAHGIEVIFSVPGIVLASAAVSLPYVVREVLPVLLEIGDDQEQAAATLGADPWTVFWRITLPSIRPGLAYGVTLTAARVLGEFGAVAVVSGAIAGKTETLTLFVNDSVENLDTVGAYSASALLALLALFLLALLMRRRERGMKWRSTFITSTSDLQSLEPSMT